LVFQKIDHGIKIVAKFSENSVILATFAKFGNPDRKPAKQTCRRRLGLVCGGRTEAVQTANKNIFFTWQSRKDYLFVIAS